MTNSLQLIPLKRVAARAFYYGFTQNEQHRGAARLWDGIDAWLVGQSTDAKKKYLDHAAYIGDNDRLSLLIERSLKRHSYGQLSLKDVDNAKLAAVLMYLIVSDPGLISGIPANMVIDPDTGYITHRTIERTQLA